MSHIKTNFRWTIVFLVCLVTMINYFDRSAISYAIEPIKKEFNFSNTEFGLIGSAFGFGYIISTFFSGILVDKFGTRVIWSLAAVIWSSAIICFTFAETLLGFLLFRVMLGIGEGPHFPSLTRTLTNWLPLSERGRAFGRDLVGVPMASLIGAPLISYSIASFGWKPTFIVLGIAGLVWAIIWFIFSRPHPIQSKYVSPEENEYITKEHFDSSVDNNKDFSWVNVFKSPSFLSNIVSFFSFGYIVFFAITWLPGYLQQTYQLNLKETGIFLIVPWLAASVFLLLGGRLSDYLLRKTGKLRYARSHVIWPSLLLSALSFLPVILVHDVYWSICFISLGLGFAFLPNSSFLALNADLSKEHAGKCQGILSTFFALSGIFSPFITGYLTDLTGNFKIAIVVMIVLTLFSAISILLFQFPDKEYNKY